MYYLGICLEILRRKKEREKERKEKEKKERKRKEKKKRKERKKGGGVRPMLRLKFERAAMGI
jgi:hypothetical protein